MDNKVYVAKCENYDIKKVTSAVNRTLKAFGGAKAILGDKKRVIVKPNLIMPKNPKDAATTHPAVVEAVCKAFVDVGADVEIIDSTGGPHTKFVLKMLYGKTGMKKAAENSGAKLSFNTESTNVFFINGRVIESAKMLSPVIDADLVISVAKMKTHGMMAMTGCVKNLFGCITGMGKPNLHRKYPKREDFAGMLVDICDLINPAFSMLDGIYGMEGAGPTGGDPKFVGAIVGGVSPYAVDLAQSRLMGLRTDSIYTLKEAAARGFAPTDPTFLAYLGDDHEPMRTNFKPAIKHKADVIPKILENCIGCGDCERICPAKCITIKNKKAIIHEKDCIRCYCCHEFCPVKAIEL